MCEYCEGKKLIFDGDRGDEGVYKIDISGNELLISSSADAGWINFSDEEFPINYCPMCGRSLKNETIQTTTGQTIELKEH